LEYKVRISSGLLEMEYIMMCGNRSYSFVEHVKLVLENLSIIIEYTVIVMNVETMLNLLNVEL